MIRTTATNSEVVNWEGKLAELFRQHYALMYRTACAIIGNRADAEDVIQNLFLKFVQADSRLQITRNPQAYLHRAVVNASFNTFRSRVRRHETDGVDQLEIPEPCTERENYNIKVKL